jgi:hypothetical protein
MVKDIYDMLLDKSVGTITDEQYDGYWNEHRWDDITNTDNNFPQELKYSDFNF